MFQKLRGLRRQSNIMGAQGCKIEISKVRPANGHDGLDWIGLDWIQGVKMVGIELSRCIVWR